MSCHRVPTTEPLWCFKCTSRQIHRWKHELTLFMLIRKHFTIEQSGLLMNEESTSDPACSCSGRWLRIERMLISMGTCSLMGRPWTQCYESGQGRTKPSLSGLVQISMCLKDTAAFMGNVFHTAKTWRDNTDIISQTSLLWRGYRKKGMLGDFTHLFLVRLPIATYRMLVN